MTSAFTWWGALCGAGLGAGVILIYLGLPYHRRPDLAARIEPYVQDSPRPSRLLARSTDRLDVNRLLSPAMHRLGGLVDHVLGGAASVRMRLERAGRPPDVEGFRAQQALWGVATACAGALFAVMSFVGGRHSVVQAVLVLVISFAAGVVGCDQLLTRAADRREQRILAEFPAVAEMLALAVTAGEGAAAALERVTALSSGELSGELGRCLTDARAGSTLPEALQGLADRTGAASLTRFVDGIVIAVERYVCAPLDLATPRRS